MSLLMKLKISLFQFVTREELPKEIPPCDFDAIKSLLQPGDVLLIQGINRLSSALQYMTKSIWTHAAICIGKMNDIRDETLKKHIKEHYTGSSHELLMIEGVVGKVVKVVPLSQYQKYHLRICRPRGLSEKNLQQVLTYAMSAVGNDITLWQVSRLIKLLLLWILLPNGLFAGLYKPKNNYLRPKICSSIIAETFAAAHFPILPNITRDRQGKKHLTPMDPRLFIPAMIDYSPYFEIIKYPLFGVPAEEVYQGHIGKSEIIDAVQYK